MSEIDTRQGSLMDRNVPSQLDEEDLQAEIEIARRSAEVHREGEAAARLAAHPMVADVVLYPPK